MDDHATREQPAPVAGDGPAIWETVLRDLEVRFRLYCDRTRDRLAVDILARDALGRQRHGQPLRAANGRDQLTDAYQEVIDAVGYLACALAEFRESRPAFFGLADSLYVDALQLALDVRWAIDRRDG